MKQTALKVIDKLARRTIRQCQPPLQRPRLSCLLQPRGHVVTLLRVLTDRGSEFCGNHEYDIDYSRSKTKSPQTRPATEIVPINVD
jgi:hypothetical protein